MTVLQGHHNASDDFNSDRAVRAYDNCTLVKHIKQISPTPDIFNFDGSLNEKGFDLLWQTIQEEDELDNMFEDYNERMPLNGEALAPSNDDDAKIDECLR